ncbi:MAG: hypothetical protein ACQERU_12185, partial [Bacteroidota bacterium]
VYLFPRVFYIAVYFLALAILAGAYFAARQSTTYEIHMLTRDPVSVLNGPAFIGVLSNIGNLVWAFTVAIIFYSVLIQQMQQKKNEILFLLSSGIITTILLIDDFFMFHEKIAPGYLKIPEHIMYLIYVLLITLYLILSIKKILRTDYIFLMMALFFLGASVITDLFEVEGDWLLLEDGLKFLGIISWFIYFLNVCLKSLLLSKNEK